MIDTGLNTAVMSFWGEAFLPCNSGWVPWAPMQTAPQAHDELFTAATGRDLLIIPFIESRGDWAFRNEFPIINGNVAPGTVSQIVYLINRYLKNSTHPEWADQWAQVYDRTGQPRYAVTIIHASSNRLTASEHAAFAAGFDLVADEVLSRTGRRVGFFIDALPPDSFAPGAFKPSPQLTGPHLANTDSFLGVMCYLPEIWAPVSGDSARLDWKEDFSANWASTGIPFIMDVSPGYDAHLVFPNSPRYGLSLTWLHALTNMTRTHGHDGLIYNSWNGYTEGLAAMQLEEFDLHFHDWLKSLTCLYPPQTCKDLYRCTSQQPLADLNQDCQINLKDLAILNQHWLQSTSP